MSTRSTEGARRPRVDAARNRERILTTARELFTEHGDTVQLADVARAAGVGVGTVYRHFPTRQALVEAAAGERFTEILAVARNLTSSAASGDDLVVAFLRHVGEILESDRGLSAAIEAIRGTATSEPLGDTRTALESAVADLISRARAAGTVRDDTTVADIYMIIGSISATVRTGSGDWHRLLELIVAGIRPRGA